MQGFLRPSRDPIRVSRIENRVPAIRENHHRVPRIKENRVPTGSHRVPNIFLKKTCIIINWKYEKYYYKVKLIKNIEILKNQKKEKNTEKHNIIKNMKTSKYIRNYG